MGSGAFEGRLVLITGASAGIGRAASLAFARQGARVAAVARRRERLESLTAEAGGNPPRIVAMEGDVADGPAMASLASRVLADLGVPDVIVANAGIGLDARLTETSDVALRSVFETNVFGVVRTIRPFLSPMIRRGSGRVLIVSSVVGKRGIPNYSAYSGSKFALDGIADALRVELVGTGVTVGVVYPSSTETEFQGAIQRSGPAQRRTRIRRHSAESVARVLLRMARSTRREALISAEGKLMVVVDALAPGLLDRILAKALVRPAE